MFQVVFLAVHPFQDGNGRLSRVLTNLQLLRAGYAHASYSSLESIIERSKEAYYLALRRTQTTFKNEAAEWEPWLLFFPRAMRTQIERLRERVVEPPESPTTTQLPPGGLSPLAERLLMLLYSRRTLSLAEAAEALGANRHTLKSKFAELVEGGFAELRGKGRGAHYRPAKR